MRKKLMLLVGLLFIVCGNVFAQLSNEQIIIEAKRYQEAGMSQTQIIQELTKKGVTPIQLQRLREAWERQNNEMQITPTINKTTGIRDDTFDIEDIKTQKWINPKDTIPREETIFGHDFFSQSSLTFAPSMNMPTPANYVLGPGDEIIIDVWGDSELNLTTVIAPDGYITVSGLGRIEVSGMSVERATARIRNAFASIYSDLDSEDPYTFLGVSVGNTRTIKVNVMGEVVQPGTYTLTSFATAFHALYAAGGPNELGSLRAIQVFRDGKVIENIDLYDYLMDGNSMNDISLRDGDIIKVNPYGILAQVTGFVKRPMKYEMRPNESLEDLIRFAGGFSGKAYKKNVLVDRQGDVDMESFTVNDSQYAYFNLKDGDIITVGDILDEYSNSIEIDGAVHRPGKYAIGDELQTVKDLLEIAQGPTGDAYLYRALLYRENEDLTLAVESIDIVALMSNRLADIKLKKNDRLFIPSVLRLDGTYTIYIGGEVRNPGEYSYADNLSVEDMILRAGGLNESASTARVDVYRRIKDPAGTKGSNATSEIFSFSLNDGLKASKAKDFTLSPFDQVIVRKSPSYNVQENIYIEGEVLFSGQYAKQYRDERLSSIIKRAGGVNDKAYIKGAKLKRRLTKEEQARTIQAMTTSAKIEKDSTTIGKDSWMLNDPRLLEDPRLLDAPGRRNNYGNNYDANNKDSTDSREDAKRNKDFRQYEEPKLVDDQSDYLTQYVGIDLAKALSNPGGDDDIILRDGDVIIIPTYSGTVTISGGVLYPNTVTYKKGLSMRDYIQQAGGFSRLAMRRKPYVVYMNGNVATGRRAKIEPGCEIIVPEKPDREPMSPQAIMGLTTSVVTIATLLISVFR